MKLESVVIAFQHGAVNTSLLLAHTARQTTRVRSDEAVVRGVRIWVLQGGLSRNKVAVGESAAGSPPNEIDFANRDPTRLLNKLKIRRYRQAKFIIIAPVASW
jgi:hypothetical protein